jgi:AcrR family transcriptional regulator
MSDVADRAGISIGSLYQYFPDKGAIIRTLVERFNEEGRACVIAELAEIHSVEQLRTGLAQLLDEYYEMYLNTPVIIDIFSGARADRALKDIEIEDARKHAAFLLDTLKRIWPQVDETRLATSSLLFFVLGTEAVRLAVSSPREEGNAIVTEYKRLVDAQYSLDPSAS